MLLLVGLGNPGPRHAKNRHNIGFMALDEIVRRHGFGPWRTRFHGRIAEGRIEGEKVLALEPETYMNESGRAVGEAVRFYKLDTESQVIVIYDEIDLKPGKVKVKLGGGAGGHNGIRSIDSHIGRDYRRLRLGIGHPGDKDLVHGYVLQDFTKAETAGRDKLIDAVASELPRLIAGDDGGFMSRLAHIMNPPKPKAPKPESPKPEADEPTEAEENTGPETGPKTGAGADGL
jgi:PTH1 family peptidyl-tRNA hydrolase